MGMSERVSETTERQLGAQKGRERKEWDRYMEGVREIENARAWEREKGGKGRVNVVFYTGDSYSN